MSIAPPRSRRENVPTVTLRQLAATAQSSGAIVMQPPLAEINRLRDDEVVKVSAQDFASAFGDAVATGMFEEIVPTGANSLSLDELPAVPLIPNRLALHADVFGAYTDRILAMTNTASEWLTPMTFNIDPLVLFHIVRTDADRSRTAALADIRRRLDRAKAVDTPRSPREVVINLTEIFGLNQLATARAVGVTPTAVRKWRRGEQARPESRDRLALLTALLRLLRDDSRQAEPAAWIEVPVSSESTLTPLDLFSGGRADLVVLLASGSEDPQDVLEAFDPDWRVNSAPDREYEVVVQPDGERSVIPRPGAIL